jgi:hypothetical protein
MAFPGGFLPRLRQFWAISALQVFRPARKFEVVAMMRSSTTRCRLRERAHLPAAMSEAAFAY